MFIRRYLGALFPVRINLLIICSHDWRSRLVQSSQEAPMGTILPYTHSTIWTYNSADLWSYYKLVLSSLSLLLFTATVYTDILAHVNNVPRPDLQCTNLRTQTDASRGFPGASLSNTQHLSPPYYTCVVHVLYMYCTRTHAYTCMCIC